MRVRVEIPLVENVGLLVANVRLLVDNVGLLVDNVGLLVDNAGLLVDNAGLLVDNVGLLVDNVGLLVDKVGLLVDNVGLLVDNVGLLVDNVGPLVDNVGPLVDNVDLLVDIVRAPQESPSGPEELLRSLVTLVTFGGDIPADISLLPPGREDILRDRDGLAPEPRHIIRDLRDIFSLRETFVRVVKELPEVSFPTRAPPKRGGRHHAEHRRRD